MSNYKEAKKQRSNILSNKKLKLVDFSFRGHELQIELGADMYQEKEMALITWQDFTSQIGEELDMPYVIELANKLNDECPGAPADAAAYAIVQAAMERRIYEKYGGQKVDFIDEDDMANFIQAFIKKISASISCYIVSATTDPANEIVEIEVYRKAEGARSH